MEKRILKAAKAAYDANRIYCEACEDISFLAWEDAPDWQRESVIAGVKQIAEYPLTTLVESHDGWMRKKLDDGWTYGPVKDPDKKEHPCIVPYSELPEYQRMKDSIFVAVVRGVLAHYNG